MISPEYQTKLLDPRWQRRRLEIFNLHDFTCQDCGDKTTTLHAHHCIYYNDGREPWDYADHCFRCLCDPCHGNRHSIEKSAVEQFRLLMARNSPDVLEQVTTNMRVAREEKIKLTMNLETPILPWPGCAPEVIVELVATPLKPRRK